MMAGLALVDGGVLVFRYYPFFWAAYVSPKSMLFYPYDDGEGEIRDYDEAKLKATELIYESRIETKY